LRAPPANASRTYGTPNPVLTGAIAGVLNGDNITASYRTTATLTSPVGTYPITATLNDPNHKLGNYNLTVTQGTLTITSDPLLVTTTAGSGPGSLRDVIANAPLGSTVHFLSGLRGTIILTSGPLAGSKDVSIAGPGAGVITVSGNQAFRVLQIAPAVTVTISGLTIADGRALGNVGGGIANDGTLTLSNVTVSANYAAPRGGGIYNGSSGTLTLSDSRVSGNSTTNAGGGIFNVGTMTIENSAVSGNGSTDADGGGVYNVGTLTINHSTLWGNGSVGAFGGAVRNDGVLMIEQSTLSGNTADAGGAVFNVVTMTVSSGTLSGNTAVGEGGGIDNYGTLISRNTILAGNTVSIGSGPDLNGILTSLGHNLIGTTSGAAGFVAGDLLNV